VSVKLTLQFSKFFKQISFRNSSILTKREMSLNSVSDDEDDYLDTCPIYHDIDSQSIYGIEVVQQPFKKSDDILWKDCM
jgi:hypothetical protein